MSFISSISPQDRAEMTDSFRKLLARHGTEADVRTAIQSADGFDRDLWRRMAEMGVIGAIVDPDHGGIGGGAEEVEALMEVAGASLLAAPLLVSIVAASLLAASTDSALIDRLLPALCSGDMLIAVALASERGRWTLDDVTVVAQRSDAAWLLDGVSSYVLYGQAADAILVVARVDDGLGVFVLDAAALAQATRVALPTHDPVLRIARLAMARVPAHRLDGVAAVDVRRALDVAIVGLAGEQAGGARRIFEITIDYLKTRYQFGRPIGSFQAVKHMAADMLVEVEAAAAAARAAAGALARGTADAGTLVALAGFASADAYRDVAAQAIQLHGGIAFTWEHPAHLYWRRARTGLWLFGSSDLHRETYLSHLEQMA